jgi:tetratricopeptide (TPR) repeat protein
VIKYNKYEEKENTEAITLFKKALNSSDLQLQVRARTGLCNAIVQEFHRFNIKDKNLLEDAVRHGEEACRLSIKLDSAHKCLGFAYHQYSEALEKKFPHGNEGNQFRSKAIMHYKKAIKLNSQHYVAYNNLGNLYLEWSKHDSKQQNVLLKKAIREFKRSLGINPRYHHAYDNLGNCFVLLGRYEEAKEAYLNALLYHPNYPEANNDLALLFLHPDYKSRNSEYAESYHKDALKSASESQKQKLISQYQEAQVSFTTGILNNWI